ncbi:hypothetical protein, conserved [Entamoeba histolytica]
MSFILLLIISFSFAFTFSDETNLDLVVMDELDDQIAENSPYNPAAYAKAQEALNKLSKKTVKYRKTRDSRLKKSAKVACQMTARTAVHKGSQDFH